VTDRIVMVTLPWARAWAQIEGSPLATWGGEITEIHLEEPMDDDTRAQLVDAALPGARALLAAPWAAPFPRFTDERWTLAENVAVIAGTFDYRFEPWLDVAAASRRGVAVIDTSRSMTPTVAEFALAMTLNVLRDIPTAIDLVRSGSWKEMPWDQPDFIYGDLTGRRVGLAGFGSINRRYAELLAPFRCTVRTYDPFVPAADLAPLGIERAGSLAELASGSEVFVVGIPPTPATLGIIDREVIECLPRGSTLIIVTRMAVVDQGPLWRRVEAGEIRVAADVFQPEPPPADASFRTSPYVYPTPHIAGDTFYCHRRCFTTACEDLIAVLDGRQPVYVASPRDDSIYRGTAA
jgi:D-3-phosphoglycerate dehydrogenase